MDVIIILYYYADLVKCWQSTYHSSWHSKYPINGSYTLLFLVLCSYEIKDKKNQNSLKTNKQKTSRTSRKFPRNTAYQILILLLRPLCIQQNYSLQMIKPQLKNILNKNIYMTAVTKHCELFPDNPSSLGDCRNA